ncbi:MAG TPA: MaoC family dehydratase [Paracoccaceae bacterium]|nr:MaoC family dehydratase [Paracoccaceae bacterium]
MRKTVGPFEFEDMDPLERDVPVWTFEDYQAAVGKEIGVTAWHEVTQEEVDGFAVCTDDRNIVHVSPEGAKGRGLDGTIAHGFYTLSLLAGFAYQVTPMAKGAVMGLNYGLDKVRFIAPVPVGSRVRGRITVADARMKADTLIVTWDATVEIEGREVASGGKPALAAIWLSHIQLGEEATA